MKFPLSLRILGWFFLNLILLGLAFLAFSRFQLHFGLDSLIAGQARDRIVSITRLIDKELDQAPREKWDALLGRFDAAYGIHFALFDSGGEQISGQPLQLPWELRERMPPPNQNRPPGRPNPDRPPRPHPPENQRGPRLEMQPPVLIRAGKPPQYWTMMYLAPREEVRPGPLFLVVVSDSMSAGGLIFDVRPWFFAGLGVLVFSVLFWLPLVRGITRVISQMTAATGQIASGNFEAYAPENRSDELGMLGQSINRMATRLAGFIQGQKRFLGDTAHELVSPLARMEMGLSILDQRVSENDRAYLAEVHEEVRHMSDLVNELLSFSKASIGLSALQLQVIPVHDLVEKTLKREVAENVEHYLPDGLKVLGDFDLLQRALGNVVRNALRHAGHADPLRVSAFRIGKEITITVADNGPGIPEAALAQIFDPFFRLDASRDRATGGTGLGLAITKSCVEACGGKVSCRNRKPNGLEMLIVLQAAD